MMQAGDSAGRGWQPQLPMLMLSLCAALGLALGNPARAASGAPGPQDAAHDFIVSEYWIPMHDGVRLSATIFLPQPARPGEKFAAVLEYLPYRKDESPTHIPMHEYFARHGYASARVDIRGTGRSEGHAPPREYSQQEQADATEVIAWLAHQKWSNGSVGMFGISWGGFNSVQMAMRNPPGLKAIIAVDATEELFYEDVHFLDGMMHADEYELNVDLTTAMTRAPDFPTDEKSLAERFDNPPWFVMYKQHPRAGAFWDEPVRPLESVRVPMFLIGGFLDGYKDSIPRMLERVHAPVKALLGPWNHSFPHHAVPGPAIEWRDQAVAWWDHWLKGIDNHVMDGPQLAVYMNHWYPPDVGVTTIPGEWRLEPTWPPLGVQSVDFFPAADHSLARSAAVASTTHQLAYRPAATQEAGGPDFWWGDVNGDQRSVDAYSLQYDSAPLESELSMLGRPRACLDVSADAPAAAWFVRVSDRAPDGQETLVSGAGLSGAHRKSMREPKPLEPGHEYRICIDLHMASWVFPRGHRIHVAIGNAFWPTVWPTPYAMTTTLRTGGQQASTITLPVVPARNGLPVPRFAAPEVATAPGATAAAKELNVSSNVPGQGWTISRDPVHQGAAVEWRGGSTDEFPWGSETISELMQYRASDLHPEQAGVHGEAQMKVQLPGRELLWRGILDLSSDGGNFHVSYARELLENGKLIRQRSWQADIPRDGQ
jgi:predicted acyl esterase